jgi:hypothetical protein
MTSNPGQIKAFFSSFHTAIMLLFYIFQRIALPKFRILLKSITISHCMVLLQVALVSIPPRKFVRPPCWYYQLQEIEKYDFRVVPNGIKSIPNYMHTNPSSGSRVEWTDRQTWSALYAFISWTLCKESTLTFQLEKILTYEAKTEILKKRSDSFARCSKSF